MKIHIMNKTSIARSRQNCQMAQERTRITLLNVKPTVGFTLPWAGASPCTQVRNKRCGAPGLLELLPCHSRAKRIRSSCHSRAKRRIPDLRRSLRASSNTSPVIFTGEAASAQSAEAVRVPRLAIMLESSLRHAVILSEVEGPEPALSIFEGRSDAPLLVAITVVIQSGNPGLSPSLFV
jgi:hypothetical protein